MRASADCPAPRWRARDWHHRRLIAVRTAMPARRLRMAAAAIAMALLQPLPVGAQSRVPPGLVTQHGAPFTDKNLAGSPFAIFFGFTSCPDICPTTLMDLTGDLAALGATAEKLSVLFVSVDPERDTP